MNRKVLFIYGYLLPFIGAGAVALIPFFFDSRSYLKIAMVFQDHIGLAIGLIAISVAVSIPIQSKVISEDDPIVLRILDGTEVRKVFKDALYYQFAMIMFLSLVLLLGSTSFPETELVGVVLLFASGMIAFESLSMFSNGRSYSDLREKIILKTTGSRHANGANPDSPPVDPSSAPSE